MATEDPIVSAVAMRDIPETTPLYSASDIDTLLAKERELTVERENAIKTLIEENDDCFDDMCTALNPIAALDDVPEVFTVRDLRERVNILTSCLKQLREGILD